MNRWISVSAMAAGMVLAASGAASAGEVNGQGQPTQGPVRSNSACAYSGLNDDPTDPNGPGRVQSFGQIVRFAGPLGGANSVMTPFGEEGCNAHLYPNQAD